MTAHGQDVRNLERRGPRARHAGALRRERGRRGERLPRAELAAAGIALPPVHVVNMGVDLDRFAPSDRGAARARLGLAADGPLVVAVGGLTERKNPLTLLQAFARSGTGGRARLALVGDGPLAGAVDAGARRLGLAGAVVRPGAVPRPGRRLDGRGRRPRHGQPGRAPRHRGAGGLAGGRPVVATRVGGAREVVPDPEAGRVVDPADPVAIAAALLAVLDDPPSPEACRRAAEPHSLERQAERVAAILATPPRRPPLPADARYAARSMTTDAPARPAAARPSPSPSPAVIAVAIGASPRARSPSGSPWPASPSPWCC